MATIESLCDTFRKNQRIESLCETIRENQMSKLEINISLLVPTARFTHAFFLSSVDAAMPNGDKALQEDDIRRLVQALEQNTSIKSIVIMNGYEDHSEPGGAYEYEYVEWPKGLLRAIGELPNLEELAFHESKLDEDETRVLFAGLNERARLKSVYLGSSVAFDSKETYALILQLLAGHTNLEDFKLGRSPPASRRAGGLHIAIPLKELARIIPSWPNLKCLEFCHLRNAKSNDRALSNIAQALHDAQSLQEFRLSWYRSGRTGSNGLASLMRTLATLPDFQKLDCGYSRMNEADASAMARAVRDSQSLVHLNLCYTFGGDNWYKDQHPAEFFADIFRSSSLKVLQIDGTYLNRERAITVSRGMERNANVRLEMNSYSTSPGVSTDMIHYYGALNEAGRGVMQDESSTVSQQVESLTKANGHVPLLYHLIRENPNKRALFESVGGSELADAKSNAACDAARKRKRD